MTITVRPIEAKDIPECVAIINPIIEAGGSTAYETPFTEDAFESYYLIDPQISLVAVADGRVVGFQGCFPQADPKVLSVGTFSDRTNPVSGAGRALFAGTVVAARKLNATAIIAKITSDNTGGLTYYSKMGFKDWKVVKADHTRPDGTKVDRIIKRFDL